MSEQFLRKKLPSNLIESGWKNTLNLFLLDWAVIIGAAFTASQMHHFAITTMAIFLIASRQHALFLIVHEGAHFHLSKSKSTNDLLSNLFAGWPIGVSTTRFREHHWKHHNHTNTEMDPDWVRKSKDPNWKFPKARKNFWMEFIPPYFRGQGALEMLFMFKIIGPEKRERYKAAVFYVCVGSVLSLTATWSYFFTFWLVPYLTVLPILNKVRSIVEHLALPNTNTLNGSRNIYGSPVESFFFGPHGNSLHLIHHLYPNVPWHKIETTRKYLIQNDDNFKIHAHENLGYFLPNQNSVYRDLVKSNQGKGLHYEQNAA